jgi:hypothetical protein
MSDDLRQKIIEIICEEWPTPDGYLESAAIHERLGSQGVEVTDAVLTTTLSEMATSGRITLTLVPGGGNNPDQIPVQGGATIHDIEDDLCE